MENSFNFFTIISSTGLVVKFVLLTLIIFSIASWTIILLKFFMLRTAERETREFSILFWRCKNLSDAYSKTKELKNSPAARVFKNGYLELKKIDSFSKKEDENIKIPLESMRTIGNIKRKMNNGITDEMKRLVQLIPFLATAGNTAPFIGLFGTVWGIMDSFHNIGVSKSVSLAVVAPGISEALVATAVGLAVAIPSVMAYNYFSNKLDSINSMLESFSADFLNIVELEILKSGNH